MAWFRFFPNKFVIAAGWMGFWGERGAGELKCMLGDGSVKEAAHFPETSGCRAESQGGMGRVLVMGEGEEGQWD